MTHTAKHTPGPWIIRTHQNLTAICTPKGEMQLSLHGVHDGLKPLSVSLQEWLANATLIAAAPAMYEALKGCLRVAEAHLHDTLARWEDYEGKVPSGIAELDAARMEVVRIQAALAQAEGRQA